MIECLVSGETIRDDVESVVRIKEKAWDGLFELRMDDRISNGLFLEWVELFEEEDSVWLEVDNFLSLCGFADPEFEIVGLKGFTEDEGVDILEFLEVVRYGDVIDTSRVVLGERFRLLSREGM